MHTFGGQCFCGGASCAVRSALRFLAQSPMPGTLDQELTTTSSDVPDVEEKEHTSDIDADVDTESTQENDGKRGTLVSESNRMDVAEILKI